MNKKNNTIEYPDAPSGAIHLYNYKEPLMKNDTGIGFQGVLACDAVTGDIQCSLCGWWGQSLNTHIQWKHGTRALQYKDEFGLSPDSALVSEAIREKMIQSGRKIFRMHGKKMIARLHRIRFKKRIRRKLSIEKRNSHGTCPEQLLDKMQKFREELGRRPSMADFRAHKKTGLIRSVHLVFGGYSQAVKLLGWEVKMRGRRFTQTKFSSDFLLGCLENFMETHNRLPTNSDCLRKLLPSKGQYNYHFGGLRKAREMVLQKKPNLLKKGKEKCFIVGCNREYHVKGLCSVHYHQTFEKKRTLTRTDRVQRRRKECIDLAKEGLSQIQIAKKMGVSGPVINNFVKRLPEFEELFKIRNKR